MGKTISVRIPEEELKDIEKISKYKKAGKAIILRDVLAIGIKQKMLEIALEKFQKNEVTASRAARIAGVPLTLFLDILRERGISFHYSLDELREDVEDLI